MSKFIYADELSSLPSYFLFSEFSFSLIAIWIAYQAIKLVLGKAYIYKENSAENQNFTEDEDKEGDKIPSGVSIESASYMEQNNANSSNEIEQENLGSLSNDKEEYTPKLFSSDSNFETENNITNDNEIHSEKLFDQDSNEEEDFEIPAFLRKQKF